MTKIFHEHAILNLLLLTPPYNYPIGDRVLDVVERTSNSLTRNTTAVLSVAVVYAMTNVLNIHLIPPCRQFLQNLVGSYSV